MTSQSTRISAERAEQLLHDALYVTRLCCNHLPAHDREDLAQDALVALLVTLREGQVDHVVPWLVAVVRKLYAMRCRARSRHRVESLPPDALVHAAQGFSMLELDDLLNEVRPRYSKGETRELRALAQGQTRRSIALAEGEPLWSVEARIKKNLKRLQFFVEISKRTSDR